MSGPRIRKPVNELTPDDLERFPVWEYALDEEGVGAKMKLRCDLSSQMGCLIQTMGPSLCVPS